MAAPNEDRPAAGRDPEGDPGRGPGRDLNERAASNEEREAPATHVDAVSMAAAVRQAYERDLSPEGGFLPPVVPLQTLPPGFESWVEACRELADRYSVEDAHTRPWLDALMGNWDPELATVIDAASEMELHALMTAGCLLAHAYRWDSLPPRREAYELTRIDLPAGLQEAWSRTARRLDIPRVTSTFHIVLNNWRLSTRPGGSPYKTDDLTAEHLDLLYNWAVPPVAQQLRMFMMPVILAEARGSHILPTIVGLVSAAAQQNAHETAYLLDKLQTQIQEIVTITSTYIRKAHITPDVFLTYIQPNLVWGLDEGDGLPASPSGAQVGIIQSFDSVLRIRRESPMGKVILKGREYMPVPHRRFLETLDAASSIVRDFVEECGEPQLLGLYNECLNTVRLWRTIHQKRGSLYLKGEKTSADELGYASSGGLVGSHGMAAPVTTDMAAPATTDMAAPARPDMAAPVTTGMAAPVTTDEAHPAAPRPVEFEAAMEQRIQETLATRFPVDKVQRATVDTAFQYLTADDRERLMARRQRRHYGPGEVILQQGSRRQGIFLVAGGRVRVARRHAHGDLAVASVAEGELFGEMSFLENTGASASVIADVPCAIDVIDPEHVYELLGSAPGFAHRFFQSLATFLSRRLRTTDGLLAELLQHETPRTAGGHARRTGHLGDQALPPEVLDQLDACDAAMRGIEQGLSTGRLTREEAQLEVGRRGTALLELLDRRAGDDAAAAAGVRDIVFRRVFPWLMTSELADQIFNRGWGYSLSHSTFEDIRCGEARGDGRVGPLVDDWLRTLPTIRSLRGTAERIARLLRQAPQPAGGSAILAVTCLGYGPAGWLLDLVEAGAMPPLMLTCVDLDSAACAFGAQRARMLGVADRVRIAQDNLVRLAEGHGHTAVPPQDAICVDALLYQLADADAGHVLDWIHANLVPGGRAIVVNLDRGAADRLLFDHLLDWGVVRRDVEELNDLFARSEFGATPVEVELDEAGVSLYATCTKR